MGQWLKEPLLHFAIAGALLFSSYSWINRGEAESSQQILHLSAAEVDWLQETWIRQWQRPPTESELRGLVSGYLKESLLAREAMDMGLAENDTVVRRRLAQKVEFLVEGTALIAEPVERELKDFYAQHQDQFQSPARVTFTQLFFATEQTAQKVLAELGVTPRSDSGEPSLLPRDYSHEDRQSVASVLGDELAGTIFSLTPKSWHGPFQSGYGFHLVRVEERTHSMTIPFDEARPRVVAEWQRLAQIKVGEDYYAGLLDKYHLSAEESIKPLVESLLADLQ